MADVTKYIEHVEEEEKRSHPFGVTNVLLNGLNGRKSKTTLDTGRSLTWICFFCLVLGICGVIIYLSAREASETINSNCTDYNICPPQSKNTSPIRQDVERTTMTARGKVQGRMKRRVLGRLHMNAGTLTL